MTPLRATATLGTASVVVLVAGAVAAKVVAVIGGPVGVGTVSVLASVLSLAGLVGGFGVAVHLIRTVAAKRTDDQSVWRAHQSARVTVLLTSSAVAVLLFAARGWIATDLLDEMATGFDVGLVAIALVFQSLTGVEAALINGLHRVAALATVTAVAGIATAGSLILSVIMGGTSAIAGGMLVGAAIAWFVTFVASRRIASPAPAHTKVTGSDVHQTVLTSGPLAVSQIIGTGSQLLVPFIVLHVSGSSEVGLYRAATTVSVAYLAFLLAAMGQDYLPRLAAAPAEAVGETVRSQLDILLRVGVPAILATYALAPMIVQLFYTNDFDSSVPVLRWFLIGDLVKLCSWSISFVILARASSRRFMAVEGVAGAVLLALTVICTSTLGLVGAGIAYSMTYVVYYAVVRVASRRLFTHRINRTEASTFALAILLAVFQLGGSSQNSLTSMALLGLAGVLSVQVLIPSVQTKRSRTPEASGMSPR